MQCLKSPRTLVDPNYLFVPSRELNLGGLPNMPLLNHDPIGYIRSFTEAIYIFQNILSYYA